MKEILLNLLNDFMGLFGQSEEEARNDKENIIAFVLILVLIIFIGAAVAR